MAGFSFGFGSKKGSSGFTEKSDTTTQADSTKTNKSNSKTTGTQNTSSTKNSSSKTDASSSGLSSQLSQVSSLDANTTAKLQELISSLTGGSGEVASTVQKRAANSDAALAGITDPIVANARATGERRLGQVQQSLARSAGSSQNSLVQQFGLEEATKIDQEVADLSATLGLQTRQIATNELATASQTSGAGLIAQLADVLKGSSVTQSVKGSQSQQSTQSTNAQELLSQLVASTQDSNTNAEEVLTSLITELKNASGSGSSKESSLGFGFG